MIVVVIVVPVVFSLPAIVFAVPPCMVCTPATFPLGIQIPPPIVSFPAVFALVTDRFVQLGFRFFDRMTALVSFIGMHKGCRYK